MGFDELMQKADYCLDIAKQFMDKGDMKMSYFWTKASLGFITKAKKLAQ